MSDDALMVAAQKHVPSHIYIHGVTTRPQAHYVASGERRSLKLACAINMKAGMFVKHLTGTTYQGCPPLKKYTKSSDGKSHTSMSADEYIDFLEDVVHHVKRFSPTLARSSLLTIVHDRARQHTAQVTVKWLKERSIRVLLLPPRSPDLDPLDYGVFGAFKTVLQRDAARGKMNWDQRCRHAVELLKAREIKKQIQEFPVRLKALVASEGKHMDSALSQLKKEIAQG